MRFFGLFLAGAIVVAAAMAPAAADDVGTATTVLPDGTYEYSIAMGGVAVGSSTIVVTRIGENISLAAGTAYGPYRATTQTTLAPDLGYMTFSYGISSPDVRGGTYTAIVMNAGVASLVTGSETHPVRPGGFTRFVVFDASIAPYFQMPALAKRGQSQEWSYPLTLLCAACWPFAGYPLTLAPSTAEAPPGTPHGDAALSVKVGGKHAWWVPNAATLWYDPNTLVLDALSVPSQHLAASLRATSRAASSLPLTPEPTPVPLPSPLYESHDVTVVAHDGLKLAATLTIPAKATKLIPGFVLVHGSGCADRDGTVGPNKFFLQITNRLSNNGYAVLRYDKRGCAGSDDGGGGLLPRTRETLIADARDAIAFLRKQPGIDPTRIYVLGHSEGGELVPSIAIEDGKLRGIVLLAPPALPVEQVYIKQVAAAADEADRDAAIAAARAQVAVVKYGSNNVPGGGTTADPQDFSWMRSSFGIDPSVNIGKVPCPILIVQGTKDVLVFASDTARLVNAAHATNRNVTIAMLPDDDHVFINLPGDEISTGYENYVPSYMDPRLFTAIETWLAGKGS